MAPAFAPALRETLREVGDVLATAAHDPWWIIGSAAVCLHGGAVEAADVDLLVSDADAQRLASALTFDLAPDRPNARFRSRWFGRPPALTVPAEVMAGLCLAGSGGEWMEVRPQSRRCFMVDGASLYAPDLPEL